MVTAYYHLDNRLFFECLDRDCVWVMPNHMVCRGLYEARAQFADGWVMPSFDIYDLKFEVLDWGDEETFVVTGGYHLLSDEGPEHLMAMSQCLSAVWRPRPEGWKIVHLHVSAEWSETSPGEVYPVEASRQTWRYAQAVIARSLQVAERPITFRKASGGLVSVDPSAVRYVRADGKRCVLYLVDGRVEAGCSISELEAKLPEGFARVHRSYVVNRAHVVSLDGLQVEMSDGMMIPIPAKRRAQVRRLFE